MISGIRCGAVLLEELPSLSDRALEVLLPSAGLSKFEAEFGDYWLVGYTIGADSAVLLSEDREYSQSSEKTEIIVNVKTILKDFDSKTSTFVENIRADSNLRVCGFDTLSASNISRNTRNGNKDDKDKVIKLFGEQVLQTRDLISRVSMAITDQGLGSSAASLSRESLGILLKSGLIIEFILRPLVYHREVADALLQTSSK